MICCATVALVRASCGGGSGGGGGGSPVPIDPWEPVRGEPIIGTAGGTRARIFGTSAASTGTPLAGASFTLTGSYRLAFQISMTLGALAIVLSLSLLRARSLEETG